jgi:hypothetical protein
MVAGTLLFQRFVIDDGPPAVRFTRLTLEAISSPEFRFVYDLWTRKRAARQAPARGDFDPAEMPQVLPRLLLIDIMRNPPDFRYRLAGTETFFIHGTELTGRSVLSIVPAKQGQLVWNDLCEMMETWEPQHVQLEFVSQDGHGRSYRVLRLPLSSDGQAVDMVLVIQDFGTDPQKMKEFYEATHGDRERS